MVKTNISALPPSLNWSHMVGAAILAGIGFTMSIFINCLAFEDTGIQDLGKIVILIGTLLSLLAATCWFVLFTRNNHKIALE
jgi:NhaA family Na+:H+ antiporter